MSQKHHGGNTAATEIAAKVKFAGVPGFRRQLKTTRQFDPITPAEAIGYVTIDRDATQAVK
jgi:hypothetical protein